VKLVQRSADPGIAKVQLGAVAPVRRGARVSKTRRLLRVAFENSAAFRQEYGHNLVNGGVFVPTEQRFELRDFVKIELFLKGENACVELDGEVVHLVPPEMANVGGTPGVAVQFLGASHELRAKLEPLANVTQTRQYRSADPGRRGARRTPARVIATVVDIETGDVVRGRTRDLSRSGVLVVVHGESVPVGRYVQLSLRHPVRGDAIELAGTVVREVQGDDGQVIAIGIHFSPPASRKDVVEKFVDDVQSVEHARRLGGIAGSITELGIDGLLQMFVRGNSPGTLLLRHGDHEASLALEGGVLRHAQIGSVTGVKALMRLLRWSEGTFEFHARLDPDLPNDAPLPVEAALLEAARQLDELARIDPREFPPTATIRRDDSANSAGESLTKVEEAVLDLAGAGSFSVQRVIDLIPEGDAEIYAAMRTLLDHGLVRLDL
jgi:Tfp pilus assembly protein PilZ